MTQLLVHTAGGILLFPKYRREVSITDDMCSEVVAVMEETSAAQLRVLMMS